jgi:hypothetical protein
MQDVPFVLRSGFAFMSISRKIFVRYGVGNEFPFANEVMFEIPYPRLPQRQLTRRLTVLHVALFCANTEPKILTWLGVDSRGKRVELYCFRDYLRVARLLGIRPSREKVARGTRKHQNVNDAPLSAALRKGEDEALSRAVPDTERKFVVHIFGDLAPTFLKADSRTVCEPVG